MLVLITYDVSTVNPGGCQRLHKVSKLCKDYGQRVQNSVFECLVDPQKFAELRHRLEKIIDLKKDSIRYYYLGSNWKNRVEHVGAKVSFDPEGILIT